VRCERALRIRSSRDRVLRTPERYEERVALGVDLLSIVFRECCAQDPMVVGASDPVALTQLLQLAGRTLDVGEEEGDRPVRELGHSARARTEDDRCLAGFLHRGSKLVGHGRTRE
jgi:hypothetical protein